MDDFDNLDERGLPPATAADYLLAHPLRTQKMLGPQMEGFAQAIGHREWSVLAQAFLDESFQLSDVTGFAREKGLATFEELIYASAADPSATELGGAMPMLFALRHQVNPYRMFRLEDKLVGLLDLTDVDDDIPLELLKLPFPRCYVELGTKRDIDYVVPNTVSGDHVLEGAYFESGEHAKYGKGIYVLMTGSPLGKEHVLDDASQGIFLSLEGNPERSLREAVSASFSLALANARLAGLNEPLEGETAQKCLALLCKALLYIALPTARKTLNLRYTELQKQLATVKSPGKRAKLERRGARAHDEIIIHAPAEGPAVAGGNGTGPLAVSRWRRGHFKNQPYGPKSTLRKLIFVAPYQVNTSAPDASPVPKNYSVR